MLSSAFFWLLVCAASGIALATAGVLVLAGIGWAFVCAGGFCLLIALIIFKGLTRG